MNHSRIEKTTFVAMIVIVVVLGVVTTIAIIEMEIAHAAPDKFTQEQCISKVGNLPELQCQNIFQNNP